MPSEQLLNQLMRKLESSRVFQAMDSQDQLDIRKQYQSGTDEAIMEAMKALDEAEKMNSAIDDEQQEIREQKVGLVKDVKESMHTLQRVELQEAENEDAEKSSDEADKLIADIDKAEKPKRKKFLGIF